MIEKELSILELSLLSLEELKNLFFKTRSVIIESKKRKKDTVDIEIYNCYIYKAIQEKKE